MIHIGVLLNPYHQPGAILINTKEADLLGQPLLFIKDRVLWSEHPDQALPRGTSCKAP